MIELEIINGFKILDLILILAFSNLITEQKIGRDIILRFFNTENYLNWSKYRRFIFDALSCFQCFSVWISIAWLIYYTISVEEQNIMLYIVVPCITLLSTYIIQRR